MFDAFVEHDAVELLGAEASGYANSSIGYVRKGALEILVAGMLCMIPMH